MKIQLQIPRILRTYCDDEVEIVFAGDTVGALLNEIQRKYPGLFGCICNETGMLRQHINLFVNQDLVIRNEFDTELKSGDVVSVFQAVSGG